MRKDALPDRQQQPVRPTDPAMLFIADVSDDTPPGEGNPLLGPLAVRAVPRLPRRMLRLRALEETLSALADSRRLVWLRAPSCSGKRTAVAAWIRHDRRPRRVNWFVRDPAPRAGAAGLSLERALAEDAGSAVSAESGRNPARIPRLFVVDVGRARMTAADVEAARRIVIRHRGVQLIVISDADRPLFDQGGADIEQSELRIPDEVLRDAFAAHGLSLTESAMRALAPYSGDPVLVGAFLACALEQPALNEQDTVRMARARALALLVKRAAPREADDLLVILALLPSVDERVLASHEGLPEAFVALARRGLVSRAGAGASVAYALPEELREVVRSAFIGHYLAHRERLHRRAAEIAMGGGDFVEAIAQQLTIPDAKAAVAVFKQHWGDAPLDMPRAAAMLEKLPIAELLTDLEAAAASWMVRVAARGTAPHGPVELMLRRATAADVAGLDLAGRLAVWAAQVMSLLDDQESARAAAIVAHALDELQRSPLPPHAGSGHAYAAFLLAAARSAVHRGAMGEAAERYAEVLALPEAAEHSINTYRAHLGRALVFAVNGEVGPAQGALDEAAAIAVGHAGLHRQLDRVALWSQGVVWSLAGREELLDPLFAEYEGPRHASAGSGERRRVAAALRAQVLLRRGFAVEAVAFARRAMDPVDARRTHPVISQWTTSLLGLALTASGQPGAALALTSTIPENVDHAPCLRLVRAFASSAAGDPRAALQATEECVGMQTSHARLPLCEVFLARAFAFEALGLPHAAEDAYLSALGLAGDLGIRLSLDPSSNRTIERLHHRSRERAPLLVDGVLGSGIRSIRQPRGTTLPQLSDQERRVLQYLMTPLSVGEIGDALYLSPNTVKSHVRNIYRKLGVQSRKQAQDVAVGWGLPPAPPPVS